MKIRRCFLIIVASLLACWGCDSGKRSSRARPSVGEQFAFALPDSPEFLIEETALSEAQGALDMVRLWRTNWYPVPDDRTAAPDGRMLLAVRAPLPVLLVPVALVMPVAATRLTQRDFMTDVLQTIETGGQLCF